MTQAKKGLDKPEEDEKAPEGSQQSADGAPELESPEKPASRPSPPQVVPEEAEEPKEEVRYGDVTGGVTEPVVSPSSDYGVTTTPAARPDVFVPDVTVTLTPSNDYGVATTPATRPTVF